MGSRPNPRTQPKAVRTPDRNLFLPPAETEELDQRLREVEARVNPSSLPGAGGSGRDGMPGLNGRDGAPGPAGVDGMSLNPRGDWLSTTTYTRLDMVRYLGASYVCVIAAGATLTGGSGPDVSSDWRVVVIDGEAEADRPTDTTVPYLRRANVLDKSGGGYQLRCFWEPLNLAGVDGYHVFGGSTLLGVFPGADAAGRTIDTPPVGQYAVTVKAYYTDGSLSGPSNAITVSVPQPPTGESILPGLNLHRAGHFYTVAAHESAIERLSSTNAAPYFRQYIGHNGEGTNAIAEAKGGSGEAVYIPFHVPKAGSYTDAGIIPFQSHTKEKLAAGFAAMTFSLYKDTGDMYPGQKVSGEATVSATTINNSLFGDGHRHIISSPFSSAANCSQPGIYWIRFYWAPASATDWQSFIYAWHYRQFLFQLAGPRPSPSYEFEPPWLRTKGGETDGGAEVGPATAPADKLFASLEGRNVQPRIYLKRA